MGKLAEKMREQLENCMVGDHVAEIGDDTVLGWISDVKELEDKLEREAVEPATPIYPDAPPTAGDRLQILEEYRALMEGWIIGADSRAKAMEERVTELEGKLEAVAQGRWDELIALTKRVDKLEKMVREIHGSTSIGKLRGMLEGGVDP